MSMFVNAQAKASKRATLESLVSEFLASGNEIVECPTYRSKKPKTFRSSQGAWGKGRKAVSLRNMGLARAKG